MLKLLIALFKNLKTELPESEDKMLKKTSEEWIRDPNYAGLEIIDPNGWPRNPIEFQYHWFEELIDRKEFDRRVFDSTIRWSISKL